MSEHKIHIVAPKNRWFTIFCLTVCYQFLLFLGIGMSIFAICTLNWQLSLVLLTISLLQNYLPRSDSFIFYVNKYVKPLHYFKSFTRIYEQRLIDGEKCMFTMHPHAIYSFCLTANMNADEGKLSHMSGLASRAMLHVPFIGIILRLWGLNSVNAHNLKRLMEAEKTIGLIPGGFEEATLTSDSEMRIFIKNRKGFIKYALKYDYTIYPVLNMNEHRGFHTFDSLKKARLFLNKFKLPSVVFWGGFFQIFLPLNIDYVSVVGRGLKRRRDKVGQEPTQEEIDETHEHYMKQLKRIHEKYRQKDGNVQLVFY